MIPNKLKEILNDLNLEELREVTTFIDSLIREKRKKEGHQDKRSRFKTNIAGSCIIEREREFFNQEHKITILDISPQGIKFRASANIIKGDFVQLLFRSPLKGTLKDICAKVIRIKTVKIKDKAFVEVGVQSVDYEEVVTYRRALAKGKGSV